MFAEAIADQFICSALDSQSELRDPVSSDAAFTPEPCGPPGGPLCWRRRGAVVTRAAAVAEAPTKVFVRQYKLDGKSGTARFAVVGRIENLMDQYGLR